MAIDSIGATSAVNSSTSNMGLDLQSLLRIILTQLTYQDPLKPVDNFEFMSQLGQFTALEQSRQLSEKVDSLLLVQASTQAVGLLGRQVDYSTQTSSATASGVVKAISFRTGQPLLTIESSAGQVVTGVSPSNVIQVR